MQLVVLVTPAANWVAIQRQLEAQTFAATILEATASGREGKLATVLVVAAEHRVEEACALLRAVIKTAESTVESDLFVVPVDHFTKT